MSRCPHAGSLKEDQRITVATTISQGSQPCQADTLAPGLHLGYWRWQYRIIKVPVTVVPQGEIALVLAADGIAIPAERILGKIVDSDSASAMSATILARCSSMRIPNETYFSFIGRPATTNSTSSAISAMVWFMRPAASR